MALMRLSDKVSESLSTAANVSIRPTTWAGNDYADVVIRTNFGRHLSVFPRSGWCQLRSAARSSESSLKSRPHRCGTQLSESEFFSAATA